jgi:nitrogen regulatory protein PII
VDYQLITCIVEKGRAEVVADAALRAGAHGVTIYAARGRGVRERLVFLGYLIDPEKEVVFTVTKKTQARAIFDTIVKSARLDEPGKGFAFTQPVDRVAGFLQNQSAPAVPLAANGAKRGRSIKSLKPARAVRRRK